MKVWGLLLENVEGENSVELYATKEKALTALKNYADEYRNKDKFKEFEDLVTWLDTNINSNHSYITIDEHEVY